MADYWTENDLRAIHYAGMGDGITFAGLCVVAEDTGNVLMTQRAFAETDDPAVQETWEMPGGGLEAGESPWQGAQREFTEETGYGVPQGTVIGVYQADNGIYECFIYATPTQFSLDNWSPTREVQAVAWISPDGAQQMSNLRPEMDDFDWDLVSGNQDTEQETDMGDETDFGAIAANSIPVHGILAPEDVESGDGRGFGVEALTARPLPLPMTWQKWSDSGHSNAATTTSIDRLMRKDGMIHWEGRMMASPEADEVVDLLQHFGRYGVSIDADKPNMDVKTSVERDGRWFDKGRISGACIVSIPAFAEAYIALGPHPDMPVEGTDDEATMVASGNLTFGRGAGWGTNPKATDRIHAYWTEKGQPGYDKVGWGTPGDFARAKALIGKEIAEHSPDKMRYLNQIIAQWHFDALGYWPSTHAKMDRAAKGTEGGSEHASANEAWTDVLTAAAFKDYTEAQRDDLAKSGKALPDGSFPIDNVQDLKNAIRAIGRAKDPAAAKAHIRKRAAALGATSLLPETWSLDEDDYATFNLVLTASPKARVLPPAEYFTYHPDTDALVIEEPDEYGFRRTYGYAGEWGVCHIGKTGTCVEVPEDYKGFPEFHLGRTKTDEGYLKTGLITYGVAHRGAKQLLSEGPTQAHFDDLRNAWAAVTLGQDDRGIWFSGVVLPTMDEDWLTTIEASGQVSGEWIRGALRTLLTVNVPGFPVMRSSAVFDDNGEVLALVASAHGLGECEPSPGDLIQALAKSDAEVRFSRLKEGWDVRL